MTTPMWEAAAESLPREALERQTLAGQRVYQEDWTRADRFVLEHVIGGDARQAEGVEGFVQAAGRGGVHGQRHRG